MTKRAKPTDTAIETPSDAIGFLAETITQVGLRIDPERGFLKSDGSSALASIKDKDAQFAQAKLQKAHDILAEIDVDIWEACMDMNIREAALRHCRKRAHPIQTAQFIGALTEQRDALEIGQIRGGLAQEPEQRRKERRAQYILNKVMELQMMHEDLQEKGAETVGGNFSVFFIAQNLFPVWVHKMASQACLELNGAVMGETEMTPDEITPSEMRRIASDAIMEMGWDYDDEEPNW